MLSFSRLVSREVALSIFCTVFAACTSTGAEGDGDGAGDGDGDGDAGGSGGYWGAGGWLPDAAGGAGSGGFPGSGGWLPDAAGGSSAGGSASGGAPTSLGVQVYLLFGQSNMWGVPTIEQQDRVVNPNVEVMALTNCSGQTAGQWYPAEPPLHGCIGQGSANPGVGPGDTFGREMAEAYPDDTILLVPNAIPGVSIDTFAKGQSAYASIVSRATSAQERGTIRGMIFHQGETDAMSPTWISRVEAVVENLRADLGLVNVPFVAGELPHTGCCGSIHNPLVNDLPNHIDDAYVVSAQGLGIMDDNLHFDTPAQRELGRRYAEVMLGVLAAP